MTEHNSSTIQSVERAIKILKSFNIDKVEWGVNELGRELGWHKSTVSRIMSTLERGGLLSKNPDTNRYRLGVDLIGLASHVASYMDIREISRPLLRDLAQGCQETVNLVVLDAGQTVNLDQYLPPTRQVKNIGWVGRRTPPYCTAAGKVLLAYLPPERQKRTLYSELYSFTPDTITNLDVLKQDLNLVSERGYAVSQEEMESGLNAIAAPIFDHRGEVSCAASIAGPSYRVTPELFPVLAQQLIETTKKISRRLGYQG
ncbi:MAG: IclR family transcriptional regulator [Anaerolineales bacterium]|nr:IclR family transcriptional regulator [Anaerolineales bacterium]